MSLLDRTFAIIAFLAFAGFLVILIWHVPKPGLVLVCVASMLMCAYDFYRSATIRRRRERNFQREAGL